MLPALVYDRPGAWAVADGHTGENGWYRKPDCRLPCIMPSPGPLRPAMFADETIMLPVYRDGQICRMTTVTGFIVSVRLLLAIRCPHHALS
jgi:hypothetical protein